MEIVPFTPYFFVCASSRQDIDSLGRPKRGWGGGPRSSSCSSSSSAAVVSAPVALDLIGTARPTTAATAASSSATTPSAAEFEKAWRRLGPSGGAQRMDLLRSAGGAGFIQARLSRGELGPDLLGEMVEALATTATGTAAGAAAAAAAAAAATDEASNVNETVLACLDALTATPRFALHLALLSPGQRTAGRELVAVVAGEGEGGGDNGGGDDRLARVRKAFK